jgi:hypothetical protein
MTETVDFFDAMPVHKTTAAVQFFDPPMCCPTGICGPTLDQTLLDVNEMALALQKQGVSVERYQMTSHPQAFLNNADVMKLVREKQMAALPIIVVSGKVIKVGAYASMEEIKQHLDGATG